MYIVGRRQRDGEALALTADPLDAVRSKTNWIGEFTTAAKAQIGDLAVQDQVHVHDRETGRGPARRGAGPPERAVGVTSGGVVTITASAL